MAVTSKHAPLLARADAWVQGAGKHPRLRYVGAGLVLAWFIVGAGVLYHDHRNPRPQKQDPRRVAMDAKERAKNEASRAVVPSSQKQKLVTEVVKQGDDFFRKQNFVAAEHHYQQAINLAENSSRERVKKASTTSAKSEDKIHGAQLQEAAATARYRLGFALARQHQYEKAVVAFRDCVEKYAGTNARNDLTYASIPEKAQYQLACCYRGLYREAKDKTDSAIRNLQSAIEEFTHLINRFPESPMAHQAARAIAVLNNGKLPKEAGAAYGHALRLEEKKRKEERIRMARCGPEALLWLMKNRTGTKPEADHDRLPSLEQLTKECETGEGGTSVYNLIQVGKKHAISLQAFAATKKGLVRIHPPAVLLWNSHYFIVTGVNGKGVRLLDLSHLANAGQSALDAKVRVDKQNPAKGRETFHAFDRIFSGQEVVYVMLAEAPVASRKHNQGELDDDDDLRIEGDKR